MQIRAVTAATTLLDTDSIVTLAAGTYTVTLPTAASMYDSGSRTGAILTLVFIGGSGTVTVDGNGSETINGSANQSMSVQYQEMTLVSDGSNWLAISGLEPVTGGAITGDSITVTGLASSAGLTATGAFTLATEVQPVIHIDTQRVQFSDLGSGATDAIAFAGYPTGNILVGVAIEVDTAFTAGGGDTTGLTVVLGINGGDTNRAAESVDLITLGTGFNVWPRGVGVGALNGAGTWELLFTATGGSTELDHIDAGDAYFHAYSVAPVAVTA
jgi:hypothetical protein